MSISMPLSQKQKELSAKIRDLAKKKNAVILAHNYQRPEVQDVADITGDSLALSIKASETKAEVIVFCGVHFMAETASILAPNRIVLLPVQSAGCPMANMITAEALRAKKEELGDAVVVSYVNTTAAVKAESDICCTSANVVQVIRSIPIAKTIYMTPDRNLAQYAQKKSGRTVQYWNGFCHVHNSLSAEQVQRVKAAHPEALFIAHPECRPEVLDLTDEIKSTSGMLAFIKQSRHKTFILGTETGILHQLAKANPDKVLIPADEDMICPNMKKTGLQDILQALENMQPQITVAQAVRVRAKQALDRMLAVPRD
jgi:quinolinate synthase